MGLPSGNMKRTEKRDDIGRRYLSYDLNVTEISAIVLRYLLGTETFAVAATSAEADIQDGKLHGLRFNVTLD
jgi:hypothetical protein